jgi:hypothetical protein
MSAHSWRLPPDLLITAKKVSGSELQVGMMNRKILKLTPMGFRRNDVQGLKQRYWSPSAPHATSFMYLSEYCKRARSQQQ